MAWITLLLPLLCTAAGAAELRAAPPAMLRPGIGESDPRRPVDASQQPWQALVRVQTELGGRCTGVLVAPRTVLTAAHCLVAPRSRQWVQPGSVHVLLGYDKGRYRAYGRVESFVVGPGFRPDPMGPAGSDWALLTLPEPLGTDAEAVPLMTGAPATQAELMLGGYQQDRPEVLMADLACRVLGLGRVGASPHPMLLHDCAGTRGASGAPLFARLSDGRWAVAGVVSGVVGREARGFAVPAASIGPIR